MRFRWVIIILALGLSLFTLLHPPVEGGSWGDWKQNIKANIKLGLDLQGGIFMQLKVDDKDAVKQYLEEQAGTLKAGLEAEEFTIVDSVPNEANDTITLKNITTSKPDVDAKTFIDERYGAFWAVSRKGSDVVMKLREGAKTKVKEDAINQAVYKIQNRVDELGVTEPTINRTIGSNRIVLELAGADDVDRVYNIVKEPGKLEWRLVYGNSTEPAYSETELLANYGGQIPAGTRIFPSQEDPTGRVGYHLLESVLLTASNIMDVQASRDDRGLPSVSVTLNRGGGEIFERVSARSIGRQLAIVLDGKVVSAPVIQSKLGSRFQITGRFTDREVDNLIVKIKSGSLPAKITVLDERVIGPTLGRDAIQQGMLSTVIGLGLVVLFMLVYYRRAGVYAIISLLMNLVIILGLLSGIGAVLTLPGIAGFILTIGMAVDANVLIFERIREELRAGAPVKNAVDIGFKTSFVTIMDANITTLIAAFCLWMLGEGPIKGFAIMLMIGIVSSIFTAVFCSRTFFLMYMRGKTVLNKLAIWPIWGGQPQSSN